MTKKKLYLLGLVTLLGFPIISFLIHFFTSSDEFISLFNSEQPIYLQFFIGVAAGWSIALVGWEIMLLDCMKKELGKYLDLFSVRSLSWGVILFVSLSAGIGEEIFFRGILQPFLGVILTSVIFVAIHGYINPKNWRISIYGAYMTLGIVLIGFLSERVGLLSAISAHTIIDVVLLLKTKRMLL
jgi:uncharacterized protein